jgi:hypothetical protein
VRSGVLYSLSDVSMAGQWENFQLRNVQIKVRLPPLIVYFVLFLFYVFVYSSLPFIKVFKFGGDSRVL